MANQDAHKAINRKWYQANKGKTRSQTLFRLYGIVSADYDALLEKQGGVCAICKGPPTGGTRNTKFHVDHDHVSKKIRGLLCLNCNQGLGRFKDSTEILRQAVAYIDTSS